LLGSRLASRIFVLACALWVFPLGCGKRDPQRRVLAHVGSVDITAADLQRRIDETSPVLRARYATVERRRELLESMVRDELLAQEAARRNLQDSQAVRDQMRRALVQELLHTVVETGDSAVSEAQLRKAYEERKQEFVRPDLVRAEHIFLVADARNRTAVKARAEALRRDIEVRQARGEQGAFAEAARQSSAYAATRDVGGALRFMTEEEMAVSIGAPAARAAFALRTPGDLAGPIEVPRGYEIVRLQLRTPGVSRSFEESR